MNAWACFPAFKCSFLIGVLLYEARFVRIMYCMSSISFSKLLSASASVCAFETKKNVPDFLHAIRL